MESTGWVHELVANVVAMAKKETLDWCATLRELGIDGTSREEWIHDYLDEIKVSFINVKHAAVSCQEQLIQSVEKLLEESESLCKQLHVNIPEFGSENLPLVEEKRVLETKVNT